MCIWRRYSGRPTHLKIYDRNYGYKTTRQVNETKEPRTEENNRIELIKQNTYERKNRKNTIPEALISNREKEIKEEPRQKTEHD